MPMTNPLKDPYNFIASIIYCEQVGEYLHDGGIKIPMVFWYIITKPTKILDNS